MHRRSLLLFLFRNSFCRFVHRKSSLPELDFTKPSSDRMKKTSGTKPHEDDHQSLLKFPLRGQCLFGLYPIELALKKQRRQFYRLYLSETSNEDRPMIKSIEQLAEQLSIPIQRTTSPVLDRLAFDRPHQGVCLDCSPLPMDEIQQISDNQTDPNRISLDLCLVKIHDPMNLGAITRTAHFFGTDRVILTQGTCQPSPVASKASSGALELMSIYTCRGLETYLESLIKRGDVALICATHCAERSLRTLSVSDIKKRFSPVHLRRLLILVGNEHDGVPAIISDMCHYNVSIEAHEQSQISSLNASVACALFLYHLSAQMLR